MARRPHVTPPPAVEFLDDGYTDDERAAALAAWWEPFDRRPIQDIGVRAADTLEEMRADGEIL